MDVTRTGCGSFFCAGRLLEQARGKGVSAPAILSFCAPGLRSCRLGRRNNRQGRHRRLLTFAPLWTHPLLLTGLTLELAQALLLLPKLGPPIVEQRQTQSQHGIDVFGFPMHAGAFETGLHHELVATLHTSRANGPAFSLVAWIIHERLSLLQVVHLLLHLRIAADQAAEMVQHAGRSLMFEPVQEAIFPLSRQMAAPLAHLDGNLTDVAGGMGKVENAQRIVAMALHKA